MKPNIKIQEKNKKALEDVITYFGSLENVAKCLAWISPNIQRQHINMWRRSGHVPAEYVLAIQLVTNGDFKIYDLRCDLYPPNLFKNFTTLGNQTFLKKIYENSEINA